MVPNCRISQPSTVWKLIKSSKETSNYRTDQKRASSSDSSLSAQRAVAKPQTCHLSATLSSVNPEISSRMDWPVDCESFTIVYQCLIEFMIKHYQIMLTWPWQIMTADGLSCSITNMSGGKNYLLPAMDMAKLGGPLSVVNVFAQICISRVHFPLLSPSANFVGYSYGINMN